jgi:hypothetical protein
MSRLRHAAACGLLLAISASGAAADPLADARRSAGWVSYGVPATRDAGPCCYESWRRGEPRRRACRLDRDERDGFYGTIDGSSDGSRGDGKGAQRSTLRPVLTMYLRFERGAVRELLAVGGDCPVDAGRAVVRALDGVTPQASATLLLELIEAAHEDLADEALHALIQHERVGTDALLALARDSRRAPAARRQALFWLGQSDDPRAMAEIERILTR